MGQTPARIGKYPISRRLGRGGMGEVWLARNPDLDLLVAVKTLAPHLVDDDPLYRERFIQEARTAARLNHPNVVRILDAGVEDGVHFLVMEYVAGGSVREAIGASGGVLPVGRALRIAACVARGLEAAAKLGIIHRDIKPDNVLLDEDGTPKLADLGLAKRLGAAEGTSLTATGISVGTPGYISPEQAQDSKSVDARADVYSLGATLFHMLTGAPPFSGTSAFAVMMKHVQEPLPDPRERNPALSEPVCRLLAWMMDKDPAARPQSAAEVARALEALAAGLPPDALGPPAVADSVAQAPTVMASRPGPDPLGVTEAVAMPPRPARWTRRAVALLVDGAVVAAANLLFRGNPVTYWVLWVAYQAMWLPRAGQTVGKRWLGLRVIDASTTRVPDRAAAIRRGLGYLASTMALGLGYAWALRDPQGRTWHDWLSGTRVVEVVRRRPGPL